MGITKDDGLIGNENLEKNLEMLKKEPSDEILAVTLTTIRRRMREKGHFVVSLEPNGTGMQVRKLKFKDGRTVVPVYTSFDEEMKGGSSEMSAFTAEIAQLFDMTLQDDSVDAIFLNPWGNSILLDKGLITLIKG